MEEETAKIFKLSDLIGGARYVAGVSSITSKNRASDFDWQRYERPPKPVNPFSQNATSKILEPLKFPAVLFGTLSLPIPFKNEDLRSFIECSCFQFCDGSATVCCDIVNFHPRIIGRNVRACAWNFIPSHAGCSVSGFIEIISWELSEISFNSISFPLTVDLAGDSKDDSKAKYTLFGMLESISPITMVPYSVADSSSGSASRNLSGFLVKILVCECILCQSRKGIVALRDLTQGNLKGHCFVKSLTVYFCGAASSWHPAIVRLTGSVVALSGLKRKLVYLVKDASELMHVTSEKTSLHVPQVVEKGIVNKRPVLRGLGEVGSYVGTVTGVYMQGMVVELDQELLLLLTDRQVMVPHSLRLGAIVSVRNVHFVIPKFCWTKTLVLGACVITCISIESFSPLEAGGYKKSYSQNLLWKFVDSLAFSARLWVLLTFMCFLKKFAGISSEKDILGSKHRVGLAQTYATSRLPALAYRKRHGVLMEYCKHSLCYHAEEEYFSLMKLAVPISSFRSYVKDRWIKELLDQENDFNVVSEIAERNCLSCCGSSYRKCIKKIFQSGEIAVSLLGYIKVSLSSGGLQLIDASGSIDVVIPDIPSTWDFNRIYEVEDFKVIMQGIPDDLNHLDLLTCEPFTCRSIFEDVQIKRDTKLSVFLFHHFSDEKSIIYPSALTKYAKIEFGGGNFHLLWLKHKFPLLQKSFGNQVISNRSRAFAEAAILPWDLILPENEDETWALKGLHLEEPRNVWKLDKHVGLKRCKTDKWSSDGKSGSSDTGNFKCGCLYDSCCTKCFSERKHSDVILNLPCLVSNRSFKGPRQGFVYCTDRNAVKSSGLKLDGRGILLEFDSESLYMYQGLRIGAYYIIKDQKNDFLFTVKGDNHVTGGAILVTSETCLWSLSLSSDVVSENSNSSSVFPFINSHEPCCSDINLFMPPDTVRYLKIDTNVSESGMLKSPGTFEKDTSNRPVDTGFLLPEGDLVSLHGHVVAIHESNDCFVSHPRHGSALAAHQSIVSPEAIISCIHVRVDHHVVLIFGSLGKITYPTGFGPGVDATFHRILVLGGQNQYMLLSASFIGLDSADVGGCQFSDERNSALDSVVSEHSNSPSVFPVALLSEVTQIMDFKLMQLHIRVVGIFVIVLQKNKKAGYSSTKVQSCSSIASIPLAGFIVDDGSSSCCCWANFERAANILGLPTESSISSEARCRTSSRSEISARRKASGSSVSHLNTILRQHQRVIIRNIGSTLDSSCLDVTISVDSKEPMSSSHVNFLRRFIMNACFSSLWTVVGCLMDSNAVHRLEKQLRKLKVTVLPPQNAWANGVYRCDPLAESRSIIQELVNTRLDI